MEQDLDDKSLLALTLVLLKQVQPHIQDFEDHENKFQSMDNSPNKGLFIDQAASRDNSLIDTRQTAFANESMMRKGDNKGESSFRGINPSTREGSIIETSLNKANITISQDPLGAK